jgi:predicted PurR-regulated permease PerM
MTDRSAYDAQGLLVMVACVVIISWGISQAAHLVVLILLGILVAYASLPFPEWLMQGFQLGKKLAIGLMLVLGGAVYLVTLFLLYEPPCPSIISGSWISTKVFSFS